MHDRHTAASRNVAQLQTTKQSGLRGLHASSGSQCELARRLSARGFSTLTSRVGVISPERSTFTPEKFSRVSGFTKGS